MRRIFWVGVGVTATVLVIRKSKQLRTKYSPPAIVHRAMDDLGDRTEALSGRVVHAARCFVDDFREAVARRDAELRGALLSQDQRDPDEVRRERAAAKEFPAAAGRALNDEDDDLPYSF